MPTLNLTDDELEAVFLLCSEECEVALQGPDIDSGLLHLGIQHKCFNALRPETPPSIPKATRISGAFVDEWSKGVA